MQQSGSEFKQSYLIVPGRLNILVFLILMSIVGFAGQKMHNDSIPDTFCISQDEYELFIMINEYRGNFHQPAIPLSKSLCFVARQHAEDLVTNHPDQYPCTYSSWSNKGTWTPCCYDIKNPDYDCTQLKPQELTSYPGRGYELVYWENSDIRPHQPYEMWTAYNSSRSMLIGSGKWEDHDWNAMGVAIYEGYGIIWFGDKVDELGEAQICSDEIEVIAVAVDEQPIEELAEESVEEPVEEVAAEGLTVPLEDPEPEPNAQIYYLIAASFNSLEAANSSLVKYKTEGFVHAKVIITDEKYRICLDEFSSIDEARRIKTNLRENYPDAWILSQ